MAHALRHLQTTGLGRLCLDRHRRGLPAPRPHPPGHTQPQHVPTQRGCVTTGAEPRQHSATPCPSSHSARTPSAHPLRATGMHTALATRHAGSHQLLWPACASFGALAWRGGVATWATLESTAHTRLLLAATPASRAASQPLACVSHHGHVAVHAPVASALSRRSYFAFATLTRPHWAHLTCRRAQTPSSPGQTPMSAPTWRCPSRRARALTLSGAAVGGV